MGAYVLARAWYLIWPIVISAIVPVVVQNANLFGAPVLTVFDIASSQRFVFSGQIGQKTLSFRPGPPGYVTDIETSSVWSLLDTRAEAGPYLGQRLAPAQYTAEDIYPYHGIAADPSPMFAIWQRFDANWYLKIAEQGYSAVDGSTVYFPLYPFLIRVWGNLLQGRYVLAALLVSNLALLGALYFLYRIADGLVGQEGARLAVVYLLIFPTSFFFFAPYTESLFLCLTLAALFAGQRGQWMVAGALGALAALTRLQGIVLILPLAYLWWKQNGRTVFRREERGQARIGRLLATLGGLRHFQVLALLLIPLATAFFLVATNLSLLANYEAQLHARFVLPWDNLFASIALIGYGGAGLSDFLNLAAVCGFALMCVVVWVKQPKSYGIYAVGMLLAPLFRMTTQQPLVSMTRYALALFPVFIVLAAWGRNRWVNRVVIYLSLPLNLYLSAQFFMWGWVA